MSRPQTHLQRKLNLAFSLFFLFPTAGFIFFSVKYELLSDELVPYFFLGLLSFSFIGFTILKNLFARIAAISESVASGTVAEPEAGGAPSAVDELHAIADSFQSIKAQFSSTFQKLEKKTSEISVLKDLSELCYVTFDPEEILHIALDRALLLSNSDIGSVLTLERAEPRAFTVKATIGLGKVVTTGDRIDFETSIAKYAVLNKSPCWWRTSRRTSASAGPTNPTTAPSPSCACRSRPARRSSACSRCPAAIRSGSIVRTTSRSSPRW